MLESMEGRRGMPRLRPPFPAQFGYLGRPTLINNVETLAHVARILRGDWRADAALVRLRRRREAGLLRGAARHHAPQPDRRLRRRPDRRAERDRPRRRRERDPAARRARRAADARRARRVGLRRRLRRRPGLPGLVLPAPPARRDDALLRRGVVPEVHSVPDRQPRAPPRRRGARARPRADDAQPGRRVARGDGGDLDLRSRPGARRSRSGTPSSTGPSCSLRWTAPSRARRDDVEIPLDSRSAGR